MSERDAKGWFFEPARPIRVEGGIHVRSRRGSIGERWWSRRFIDVLERVCDKGRLSRGRAYARSGQVMHVDIAPGLVTARVQGSRPEPYDVTIGITAYDSEQWRALTGRLAARALYRAKLLAGEMPPEIEEVFGEAGLPLFPGERGLDMACSCPDWGFPCKHLSAVLYVLAESFDDDPFLVLAWRGMAKDALLDALRAAGPAESSTVPSTGPSGHERPEGPEGPKSGPASLLDVTDPPFADRMDAFYEPAVSPARLRDRSGLPSTPPDLLLRALEPPAVKARHIPILDLLRPAYRTLAEEDGG
ncbi:SWIM zinc finger family protein [Microtetraspora sp. NBRC 16547]|uniref:SWIM zinc finger family protein n=1 Tax=Microtetraspora sp. NBRC 16547 TaxID=3030993 RepID=UPI0024A3DF13|nr:SWIM zinc finger family protein [Microtetraspora sp. NBRC 16547]GLW96837.1 hypothetical protein Misp02_09240 [Microtetraspora sp. NBRC 16547]